MNKPCPFCGSANLRELEIWISRDDDESEDELTDAIECLDCDAQARADRWNDRAPEADQQSWQQQLANVADKGPELNL